MSNPDFQTPDFQTPDFQTPDFSSDSSIDTLNQPTPSFAHQGIVETQPLVAGSSLLEKVITESSEATPEQASQAELPQDDFLQAANELIRQIVNAETDDFLDLVALADLDLLQDFSGADLRGIDLSGANLRSADLRGTDLTGANLSGADLSYANLNGANLQNAKVIRAFLSGAQLEAANLSGTSLLRANLSDANLRHAQLQSANLSSANLCDAQLAYAQLLGANLSNAFLLRTNLVEADLSDADLSGATLSEANLLGTCVASAEFGDNLGFSEAVQVDLEQRGAVFRHDSAEQLHNLVALWNQSSQRLRSMIRELTDEDVDWILAQGRKQLVPANTVLIQESRLSDELYIVLDGRFAVSIAALDNREIAKLSAGAIMGEISFLRSSPPTATVKAMEDCNVLAISQSKLQKKLASDDRFSAHFYKALAVMLSHRVVGTTGQISRYQSPNSYGQVGSRIYNGIADKSDLASDARFDKFLASGRSK